MFFWERFLGFCCLVFSFSLRLQWGFWPERPGRIFPPSYSSRLFTALPAVSAFIFSLSRLITKYCGGSLFLFFFRADRFFFGLFARGRFQPRRSQPMDKRRAVFLPAVGIFETGAYRLRRGLAFFQKRNIADFKTGFLPFAGILAAAGFILVLQRDMGTLGVIIISCVSLFFLGGGESSICWSAWRL